MTPLLNQITEANDIKKIQPEQYEQLAAELRRFMLANICNTGGHLAANLGVVELTMALHLFLDFPKDKLIWDVGHQSYVHKILTGRKDCFDTLRQFGGISGFPKRSESECDAFDTGHSSTSISAALGMVKARELSGGKEKIIAVIGDGALSGGMAFEALNNAGRLKSNLMIVLNDNNMSISENVGAMAGYLGKIRTSHAYIQFKEKLELSLSHAAKHGEQITKVLKRGKDSIKHLFVAGMLFENMGLTYIGPIDGHNIEQMKKALEIASRKENATLIHVVTKKGKGYRAAENNPVKFHGIDPFDRETGELLSSKKKSFTDLFGEVLVKLAVDDLAICAVTAAMKNGTGLTAFSEYFKERFFDVGIAEEHAVTFAAGLAAGGYHPVVAVYSTFLQRAYDQIIQDVCMEQLPVIFAVDRTGIVGNDGETHQGIYTNSFLGHIPGLTVMLPKDDYELCEMIRFAFITNKPCAVCYPRRSLIISDKKTNIAVEYGKAELVLEGTSGITIFALGVMNETACEIANILEKERGLKVTVVNLRFINPIDKDMILTYASDAKIVISLEENVKRGGIGEMIAAILEENHINPDCYLNLALPDDYLRQGTITELKKFTGTDTESVVKRITEQLDK